MDEISNDFLRTPISFEDIKLAVDEFMKLLNEKGYIHIVSEYIVKEFRDYYTPNIPYTLYSTDDERIYIKNGVFKIEFSDIVSPPHYMYVESLLNGNENRTKELISLKEFLYVYCNPEGLHLLEKISFIINNTDFEQVEAERNEALGIPNNGMYHDYDDEIPF